jgi:hypothetical protein
VATEATIDSIFRPTFQRWYHERNVEPSKLLRDFYFKKCFGARGEYTQQTQIFRRELRDYDVDTKRFEIDGTQCPYPEVRLLGGPAGNYLSCIVHGDLNTRNVFVSRGGASQDVSLIDFSETARGHVFFDFIVFEVNLRLDAAHETGIALIERVVEERALNRHTFDPGTGPLVSDGRSGDHLRHIARLRRHARDNFPRERFTSYFYGLAVYAFSLLNASNLDARQRSILVACTSAAMLDLLERGFWDIGADANTP